MVFHPAIFLLLLFVEGVGVAVECKVLIVLAVPCRPWRSEGYRGSEFRTPAWEELVVGRRSVELYAEVQVVGVTVGHEEVAPVLQHVAGVCQLQREAEEVVGPSESLTPA